VTVYLVGAGPGDPDLLTVRAAHLLARADAVVHDRLVDRRVLALAPTAERHAVGKRTNGGWRQEDINDLLVRLGRRFEVVVRLKGGDPYVFGRGGEEAIALAAAGLTVDVVPGVTSAFAAPLAAGVPVTHRGLSSVVSVVTARTEDGTPADLRGLAGPGRTLVVLMGASVRQEVVAQLLHDGVDPATPVAAIESAWTDRQHVLRGRLDGLGALTLRPPVTIVVGDVAAMSHAAPQVAVVDDDALVLASR
jgi:uroporphyrin-III C-methyltransferase